MIAAAVLIPAVAPDLADQQQHHRDHDLQLPCKRDQLSIYYLELTPNARLHLLIRVTVADPFICCHPLPDGTVTAAPTTLPPPVWSALDQRDGQSRGIAER